MVNVDTALKSSMDSVFTPAIGTKTTTSTPDVASSGVKSSDITSGDAATDLRALFTSRSTPPVPSVAAPPKPLLPTAQAVFGDNPWIANPGGVAPNGVTYGYNPEYFATRTTADTLAKMYG